MTQGDKELRFTNILRLNRPAHKIVVLMALSSNEGSGKSEHVQSQTRAFTAAIHKVII